MHTLARLRRPVAACFLCLLATGLIAGCAHQTASGNPPPVRSDDRLSPMS